MLNTFNIIKTLQKNKDGLLALETYTLNFLLIDIESLVEKGQAIKHFYHDDLGYVIYTGKLVWEGNVKEFLEAVKEYEMIQKDKRSG